MSHNIIYFVHFNLTERRKSSSCEVQVEFPESSKVEAMKKEIALLKRQLNEERAKPKTNIVDCVLKTDKSINFYTGMSRDHLDVLWKFLAEEAPYLKIYGTEQLSGELKFTLKEQFYMFLMKLRQSRLAHTLHMYMGVT